MIKNVREDPPKIGAFQLRIFHWPFRKPKAGPSGHRVEEPLIWWLSHIMKKPLHWKKRQQKWRSIYARWKCTWKYSNFQRSMIFNTFFWRLQVKIIENHWVRPDSVDPWETKQATGVERPLAHIVFVPLMISHSRIRYHIQMYDDVFNLFLIIME